VVGEAARELGGVGLGALDAQVQGAQAAQREPGLERSGRVALDVAARLENGEKIVVARDDRSELYVAVAGDAASADRVCASTSVWVNATSLGGVESSLERRRRWPGESTDVPETLIRLSVGIEDVEDLWNDLAAAL